MERFEAAYDVVESLRMVSEEAAFLRTQTKELASDLDLVDNYRQACSVISARDTTFDNCSFRDTGMTGGTAPQAGVDFEPNTAVDYLVNITLRGCTASNNVGGGFFLSYGAGIRAVFFMMMLKNEPLQTGSGQAYRGKVHGFFL